MKTKSRQDRAGKTGRAAGIDADSDPMLWTGWPAAAMVESMKWFGMWLQGTQCLWEAASTFAQTGKSAGNNVQRRTSDLPWVPRIDTNVIPLRRRTDQPGSQATRISMRLPMPWPMGGADVVSIEAILGGRDDVTRASDVGAEAAGPSIDRRSEK